ncbi:hypothetical protein THAOC_05038 [Thalassiosira oceanica]|uniref:Uncharacterized protein n=1 Tax=Thalassiosira oceanica TaxID=159749 RepID=K0THY0_THAOC|nr:hypothetical protein THAOC_05038 [Thalassiosira oceanica]|eukprot:EJK73346.1 hypothetical protein THAOC_05038 [Thalassiosira oceanica]
MTEKIAKSKFWQSKTKDGRVAVAKAQTYSQLERADFGGPDGHVPEGGEFFNLETIRVRRAFPCATVCASPRANPLIYLTCLLACKVTRCSTTTSALTVYFCGTGVATNRDLVLGSGRKSPTVGTDTFRKYLSCRFDEGVKKGSHHRSVYRLGVGCKDPMAGMSHAWVIVAQPDGTFYWLQSFISHYSLATWMKKKDSLTESGVAGRLTFDELMGKLDGLERLMSINAWTDEANRDYQDLFNVDKNLESVSWRSKKWTEDSRLVLFSWDEACEYPAGGEHDAAGDGEDGSEC